MAEWYENLRSARAEVLRAVRGGRCTAAPCGDAVRPEDLPSVAARGCGDRVIAEIDHDGFAFPSAPEDAARFPARPTRLPRVGNLVDVVLVNGRVAVRKRFRPPGPGAWRAGRVSARDWVVRRAWYLCGVHFYAEVAALLRLRDAPFAPQVVAVDVARRTVWMDCLAGRSLRHAAADAGAAVHDADLPPAPSPSEAEIGRRESRLLDEAAGPGWRREVAGLIEAMIARGVVPLDVKLGNLMRGDRTGQLYWIDFENARLEGQPGFSAAVSLQRRLLREHLGIDLAEPSFAPRRAGITPGA